MAEPYKVRETLTYSEDVYYDSEGHEVHRERRHDDSLYDEAAPEPVTDQELADYYDEET